MISRAGEDVNSKSQFTTSDRHEPVMGPSALVRSTGNRTGPTSSRNRLDPPIHARRFTHDFCNVMNTRVCCACSQVYTASSGRTTVRCKTPGGLRRLPTEAAAAKRSDFPSPTDLCSPVWTAEFRFCTTTDEVRALSHTIIKVTGLGLGFCSVCRSLTRLHGRK